MKKTFLVPLIAVAVTVTFVSCTKTNQPTQCTNGLTLTQDKHIIDSFLLDEGLTAQYTFDDQAGAYYGSASPALIPGTGANKPTGDSLVAFHFEGRLLDGTLIDSASTQGLTNKLSDYATQPRALGVSYALAKITKGGSISIIIPSSAAFGCNSGTMINPVPANAQVIYRYQLLDMKPSTY